MGWALAGMWYDKFAGLPPRNSPLESIFTLVFIQRQEVQLLATRAMVQTSLSEKAEAADPAIAAFQKYCDTMFPFLEQAGDREKQEEMKRLMEFVKHPARIKMQPIFKMQAENAKRMANLKRFRVRPRLPGV